jgi:hypothetical protein
MWKSKPLLPFRVKRIRDQGDRWFRQCGAAKKREKAQSQDMRVDYDEYLQASVLLKFDQVRLEQFRTIRKDVTSG